MHNTVFRGSRWSILFAVALLGLTRLGQAQDRFNFSHSALTGSQAILFVTVLVVGNPAAIPPPGSGLWLCVLRFP